MKEESVTSILRKSSREVHSFIESTRFAQAVLKKDLTVEAYLGYIRVLAIIHSALEGCLNACPESRISSIWSSDLQRLSLLLDDNDFFRWELIPDSPVAVEAALEAAAHIRKIAGKNPIALAGAVYVLCGSTKGAVILAPLVAKSLNLAPGQGLSYLSRHGGQGPEQWDAAATVMDENITAPAEIEDISETALFIFRKLLIAFEALFPLERSKMQYCATGLNPESGNHPVPQNKQDQLAVLRASDSCLSEYPYFLYRYGKRGRRYSDADGAWLITLASQDPQTAQSQVDWLGGVLSSRGMPRLLLARHMNILARELSFLSSENDLRSRVLRTAATQIQNNLEKRIPWHVRKVRAEAMESLLERRNDFCCLEAVELMASAVVDETDGIKYSIQSLLAWLTDASRFSEQWIQVINKEIKELKSIIAVL